MEEEESEEKERRKQEERLSNDREKRSQCEIRSTVLRKEVRQGEYNRGEKKEVR